MICPFESNKDGTPHRLLASFDDLQYMERPMGSACTSKNIMAVFHVVPGDMAECGQFESEIRPEWDTSSGDYHVSSIGFTVLITRCAYNILLQAAPSLKPHVIFRLYWEKGTDNLDYGPINGVTGDQFVYWEGIHNSSKERDFSSQYAAADTFWNEMFFSEGSTVEKILDDAWRGPGNLWAMVRPDRYPVKKTLLTSFISRITSNALTLISTESIFMLPAELLLCGFMHPRGLNNFLSTCKKAVFLCRDADSIVCRYMQKNEPWYLPAGPFDIPSGDQEFSWWKARWGEMGLDGDDLNGQIPWLQYRRACSHSMSMWNRIRIWKVAKQLERLAEDLI
ncbi:hypothetical protein BJ165DRAFT_575769 [Panaeolus papilionaceus]|nr:hypothetical protein BJ165DRAFT_575769 [Panaeolus papilionaceus]